jgi:hypothetical protein
MIAPKIVEQILRTAPAGADLKNWRYQGVRTRMARA